MTSSATDGSWLSALVDGVVSLMETIGPVGAGIAIALENLFPPLPSEVVLPMAGLAAGKGSFSLAEALIWTTAGSVVGALLLYGLGALLGLARVRAIADMLPLVNVEDVDRTVAWFGRHGGKAVFLGRMIPIFRSLISIPAGVVRMPLWRFALLTVAGSAIWNSVFVLSGYFLGDQWHIVETYADVLQYVVIVVAVIAVVVFVAIRVRQLRAARRVSDVDAS